MFPMYIQKNVFINFLNTDFFFILKPIKVQQLKNLPYFKWESYYKSKVAVSFGKLNNN